MIYIKHEIPCLTTFSKHVGENGEIKSGKSMVIKICNIMGDKLLPNFGAKFQR